VGEGTDRVRDEPEQVEEIAREIEELRGEMTPLLAELDRRRREVLDWKNQARKHALPVAAAAVALVLAAGWIVWSAVEERRERRRPVVKVRRLREAVARMIHDPERVAAGDPSGLRNVGLAMARTAGTTAASVIAKRAVERIAAGRV
jgi:hypothetical protein